MEECYFNRNNTPPRYVTRFINSTNGTKSCKAYYLIGSVNWLALNCQERKMRDYFKFHFPGVTFKGMLKMKQRKNEIVLNLSRSYSPKIYLMI